MRRSKLLLHCTGCGKPRTVNLYKGYKNACKACLRLQDVDEARCGTEAGYQRHTAALQPVCVLCQTAHDTHVEQTAPRCACGKKLYKRASRCRECLTDADLLNETRIKWVRNPYGVMVAEDVHDPDPDEAEVAT